MIVIYRLGPGMRPLHHDSTNFRSANDGQGYVWIPSLIYILNLKHLSKYSDPILSFTPGTPINIKPRVFLSCLNLLFFCYVAAVGLTTPQDAIHMHLDPSKLDRFTEASPFTVIVPRATKASIASSLF